MPKTFNRRATSKQMKPEKAISYKMFSMKNTLKYNAYEMKRKTTKKTINNNKILSVWLVALWAFFTFYYATYRL